MRGAAARRDVLMPPPALFDLPERAVQFGKGAVLRGFVDFFIDEANRKGLGVAFLKAVLAPMPVLRLMPTGGVTPENVGDWLRAGAVAVGVGSALVDAKLVAAGDFATLTEGARRIAAGVEHARKGTAGGTR